MMKTISISQLKGGSGRSTLAALLVAGFAADGWDVLLIDCDEPQFTSSSWLAALKANARTRNSEKLKAVAENAAAVRATTPDALRAALDAARQKGIYLVVIDSTPNLRPQTVAREALLCADLVLIPLAGTPADLWATQDFEKILNAAAAANPGMTARLVWNRVQKRKLLDEVKAVAKDCLSTPALNAPLGFRSAYATVMGGETLDTIKAAKAVKAEAGELLTEVAALLADCPGKL